MDPEIEQAHNARVPYLSPDNIGDPDGRLVRVPPSVPLAESYATQEHHSLRRGMRAIVRARLDSTSPTPKPEEVYGITKWMVTAWNPLGRVCTFDENTELNCDLLERLMSEQILFGEVLRTTPPNRSWLEDTYVFAGMDEASVRDVARAFGQPAFTAWRDKYLTVIPTGLVDGLETVTREVTVELRPMTCPMRVDDLEEKKCVIHGGPFGSRAIHAAAIWSTHRELIMPRLGCTPCGGGVDPTLGPLAGAGGPVMLTDIGLASRHGSYVWR